MSYAKRFTISLTANATGVATGYSDNVTGEVASIQYVKNNFSNGTGLVVTGDATGLAILTATNANASTVWYPRVAASKTADGTASSLTEVPAVLENERVKVVTSGAGNATLGTIHVMMK